MKRRTLRAHGIEATRILSGIYQGSAPPTGDALRLAGFNSLVLTAEEYQPRSKSFPGVRVFHVPLDDHMYPLTTHEWNAILRAANFAARARLNGAQVLITCRMGLNRSGLVTAVTAMMLTGCSGQEAVRLVRSKRSEALFNTSFAAQLSNLTRLSPGPPV